MNEILENQIASDFVPSFDEPNITHTPSKLQSLKAWEAKSHASERKYKTLSGLHYTIQNQCLQNTTPPPWKPPTYIHKYFEVFFS